MGDGDPDDAHGKQTMPTPARSTSSRPHRGEGTVTGRRHPGRPLAGLLLAACLAAMPLAAASAAVVDPPPEPVPASSVSPEATTAPSLLDELAAASVPVPGVPFLGAPEAASRFQAQVTCDPTEKPGAVRLRALLRSTYGRGTTAGITRACSVGGTSHHKEGRAYDWGLNAYDPADSALADAFLSWLVGPDRDGHVAGNARRLGVQYVIWDREIWHASSGVWKPYSGASPHTDHIHFSLSWDGALARTSFWTGTAVTQVDHGPCQVYVGVMVSPYTAPNYTRCPAPVPLTVAPVGNLEQVRTVLAGAAFSGWAKDPDTTAPVTVEAWVGDRKVASTTADRPRADVGPHGFDLSVPLQDGVQDVCLYGNDVGDGGPRLALGCRTVTRSSAPVGNLEQVRPVLGGVQVSGWTLDPDTYAPGAVEVHVDGRTVARLEASQPRPDVGAAYPAWGPNHGFAGQVSMPPGVHEVCVRAVDMGAGESGTLLGCRQLLVLGASPTGALTAVANDFGRVTVTGWALDGDSTAPLEVRVSVDGTDIGSGVADLAQSPVSSLVPSRSAGYSFTVPSSAGGGLRDVCAHAVDGGTGSTTQLGCRSITVDGSPRGSFETAVSAGGRITVSGWVVDPDVPVGTVHVYVDSVGAALGASAVRPDVSSAYPAFAGSTSGWTASYPAAPGVRRVCAYGINSGVGATTPLGCKSVTVLSGSPFGSLEATSSAAGTITVSGWVIDPDVLGTSVHVYIDGKGVALPAAAPRADVALHHPAYASHTPGFAGRWPASPGPHQVCVYGINSGPGATLVMGCRTVTVLSGPPVGSFEAATAVPGGIDVSGWLVDPDVLSASVHVYVDGVGTALHTSTTRPDVTAAFPAYSSYRHGWSGRLAASPGPHRVCAYGINAGPGGTLGMGCVTVDVPR